MADIDYIALNRANWDERAGAVSKQSSSHTSHPISPSKSFPVH